ncbi:MAG: BolA/IbaG family iron-sulfur metabolism protein [Myxococcales bacterium]|nr:BolA/IbaG family iron-sulfur metabolism protein [Myxococcales bacterium]
MSATHDAIRAALVLAIEGAEVEVRGDGRHFQLVVISAHFEGKGTLERHRMVLGAIAHLMRGDDAAVHAIDSISARTT